MTVKPTGARSVDAIEAEIRVLDYGTGFVRTGDDASEGAATSGDAEFALIDRVRDRLGLGDELPDVTIAASLAAIAGNADNRGRWLAAFGSPLGRHLATRGTDLNTALSTLVAMAPRHH